MTTDLTDAEYLQNAIRDGRATEIMDMVRAMDEVVHALEIGGRLYAASRGDKPTSPRLRVADRHSRPFINGRRDAGRQNPNWKAPTRLGRRINELRGRFFARNEQWRLAVAPKTSTRRTATKVAAHRLLMKSYMPPKAEPLCARRRHHDRRNGEARLSQCHGITNARPHHRRKTQTRSG